VSNTKQLIVVYYFNDLFLWISINWPHLQSQFLLFYLTQHSNNGFWLFSTGGRQGEEKRFLRLAVKAKALQGDMYCVANQEFINTTMLQW
jgi:hypothetical protein